MKAAEIIQKLEELAPLSLQESYDNSGLMVGDIQAEVKSAMLSLDCTEKVVDEALQKGCNLLICHHPLIFSPLKSISGRNEIERVLIKAIKNDLIIYAIHTNLDNVANGVNKKLADTLGLENCKVLRPAEAKLQKLVFFVPTAQLEQVRNAIFKAGAGHIGNYSDCSFSLEGKGTFKGGEGTDPFVGQVGELHTEEESRVEVVLPKHRSAQVIRALIEAHSYEEVAFDLYSIENAWNEVGSGMIGEIEQESSPLEFLELVKESLNCGQIRYTELCKEKIKKVDICGGSGSFLLRDAIRHGADIFITADFKYHQFFEADSKIIIADVGHFESEQYTPHLLQEFLQEKFPNFATYLSQSRTNPINYL